MRDASGGQNYVRGFPQHVITKPTNQPTKPNQRFPEGSKQHLLRTQKPPVEPSSERTLGGPATTLHCSKGQPPPGWRFTTSKVWKTCRVSKHHRRVSMLPLKDRLQPFKPIIKVVLPAGFPKHTEISSSVGAWRTFPASHRKKVKAGGFPGGSGGFYQNRLPS